ncbi:titin-like, partial [Drosophila montana]|uniref:titin-like n=1 Tax=Drosophila montana TaxID=40370 RepID=UPI00313E8FE7
MEGTPGTAADAAAVVVEPPGQATMPDRSPRITFSDNSSSLIRCIPNERATFFVKIDCDEEDETELLPFKFEWTRGDIPIENSDRFRITQTSNAVQLAVEHVQREDAGHYTLFARTKSNEVVRKHVELIVEDRSTGEDPPVFLRRLVDLSVKVGTRTRLLTEIRSSTDLKLTWYRNDRRICENDRIKETNEGTFHYLEVSPVILEDGGQWMLMAENMGGRNSCLATLNVLVPKAYKTPEFVEELRAVLTEQGTVSLECKVVGVPTPHLRWFKDSKEIKAGDMFALTANADDPTSLGTYTCEAKNCMGVTYSSSKVHVVGRGSREGSLKPADNVSSNAPPPIFTNELRNQSVHIGDTIILGCQVVVPPWPKSVTWYNKDGRVDTDERYKLIEDGLGVYMIEIKPSESCDAGDWKCVVTSFEGCVGISACVVNMDIPRNYRKPRFMESLRAVLTEEGLVSFECKVVGFPTPVLKWFKDGHELKPGDVYQLTGTNSLGTYCCIARNCMGETSSTAVLTVEDIQNQLTDEERLVFTHQNQAPKFLTGLKSTDAKINEPFQFKVVVKATPDPILSWFRDELPIDPNERYNHYRGENEDWLLDIKSAEFIDQAEWKCVAVNDFGTSITSCFLKLQIPRHYKKPRFLECLRAVLTEEGAVNLECKVIGVPQPVLKWYKDGVELKPGDIHRIISGQDGTCCLGTYTCEARNCMGVVASSASLLGFEDAQRTQKPEQPQANELQRNYSLSTIQEERTSQLYETPVGDITIDDKGDVSFSFDGKEVSVSLYETPDLTEEEALKIVEMYADQISEHVTEHNIVELPPLRFVKETSQSGKLLMEAVVIDISPEYFTHDEDMRTEADMDDISITEITVHGSSGREGVFDKETEKYAQQSFEKMEEELSLTAPIRKRKKSRPTETDEFFSLSKASGSGSQGEEETSDQQTFASAQMSTSQKVAASSEGEAAAPPKRKKSKKPTDSDSSKTTEDDARLQDISGAVGDGLLMTPASHMKAVTDEAEINKNLIALVPLAKLLRVIENHLTVVETEVLDQSTMMMTPAAADQSIAIIRNILEPIKQIESKLRVYSGETQIDALIQTMDDDIRRLHMGLQVIEKCVEIDETGATLIQRTSVCIIDSVAEHMKRALEELKIVSERFESESLRNQINLTADDIHQGLEITQGTIRSQALLQEAQELEAAKHFTEAVEKMQDVPESVSFASITEANLPSEASALKQICQPVAKIQEALERVEMELSMEENEEQIYKKVHKKVLDSIVQPIRELQSTLQSIEDKTESLAGSESIEQKINMAILDIVTPPLFELNKGLELILNEKSDSVEGGMFTVSTVESMVPPLQEIQNGLAQLGQDLESGQAASEEATLDLADTQKLLQSIAQAVLHFETNIERISERLSENVKFRLQNLKDELSALIGTILDKDIARHHVELLDKLKRPIDELNYCLRQTEVKSTSGSLADLIEPLSLLQENTQKGQGLLLATREREPDKEALQSLENIRNIIRNAIIDIEEHEFKILQQEIQQDEQQAAQQDKSFSALRKVLETKVSLEESIGNIETLQLALNRISESSKTAPKIKLSANEAQVSLLRILQIAKGLAAFSETETTLNSNEAHTTRILFEMGKSFADLAKTLNNPDADESNFNDVLNSFNDIVAQQREALDEKLTWNALAISSPLSSFLHALENLQPLRLSVENLSTLDDISVLKSSAESLSAEPEAYVKEEEGQKVAVEQETPTKPAEVLLSDLNHGIATVLSHCEDLDVASLRGEAGEQLQAAIIKMQELRSSIALVQETNLVEAAQSFSEGTDPGTFAAAMCSLERCVLEVEECIAHSGAESLNELELSQLKTLATPLRDLRQYCEQIDTQALEQALDMSTQDISDLKTSGHQQTVEDAVKEAAIILAEPKVEIFNVQQGVVSGIKQLEAALEVTKRDSHEELRQVGVIIQQLNSDLKNIQEALASDTDQQETVLAQAKIARTMFKLKECLVHTYESGLVDSLDNVESAFEDILLSLPVLESQLAQEMYAKIENTFKNFMASCQQPEAQQQQSMKSLQANFEKLLKSIKAVADSPNVDIDKSSTLMVHLQTNLMATFRALNEVSERVDNDLLGGLLRAQSSLVAVFDFIENNENTIRIIELLQEIDVISAELKSLSLVSTSPTVPVDISAIIENVTSGKAFLTEIEQGLQNDNPLSVKLLDENTDEIGQLEATLIQIENEILSQTQLTQITTEQLALIATVQLQINNLQEKLIRLSASLTAQQAVEKLAEPQDTLDQMVIAKEKTETKVKRKLEDSKQTLTKKPKDEIDAKDIESLEKALTDKPENLQQTLNVKFLDLCSLLETKPENPEIEAIINNSKDIMDNLTDSEKTVKGIFKLREHIVHTYDDKSPEKQNEKEMVEAFIESLLNASPPASEDIINSCLKEIKTNIILTKAAVRLIGDTEVGKKSSLIVPKLGNIENISENIRSKLQIEKSSEKMVHLQQNLMDIFVILDDLLDDKTVLLKPLIEDTKTVLLSEYDYIEQKQGQLQTATVEGKIQTITKHILNVCEKLQQLNKDQIKEKRIEEYQLTENNKLDAENAEKEAKEKAQKGEVPEVVAEKVSEEKVPESKKLEVKESESEAQKAKVLEQQLIEEQKLDTKQKKQSEKDAEKKAQKGEASEIVAEKVSEEKVPESKKLEVGESENEAQKAKILEQQLIEEQKLDTKQKKQSEKDAEKKAQKGEVSEVGAEKVSEDEKKVIKQNLQIKLLDIVKASESQISNEGLQLIVTESNNIIEDLEDCEKVSKCIFKLREHIVHTYDGKSTEEQNEKEMVEAFIESVLESSPPTSESIIKRYIKEIEANVILTKAAVRLIDESDMFAKPSLLIPKLVNLQNISKNIESQVHIEKASEMMIFLQQNLMDIFVILDDLLEDNTAMLKPVIEEIKTVVLAEYDYIEKAQADLKTATIEGKIHNITKEILNVCEQLQHRKKELIEEKRIEEQQLNEKNKLDAEKAEKEAEEKAQKGKVSEVVAEKVSEEKVPESQKPEIVESESDAQKAKVLEQQLIEEQKLDTKQKKQAEKDSEKKPQKGEASEVVAEKDSEEKVPESKKLEVEESESEAQQAKMLEQQLIEEQNLYTEQKKQSEKDAEAKAQKGEASEVVAEKDSEEKVPESKKLEVEESESEAQQAKMLEQQLIEKQKLDTKQKEQVEKDAEKKAQKGEASEVVAEKVSEEKVPESKKLEVGESESAAQKAKILEQQLIEEQKLDTKQKEQLEKDAEKKAQKGEASEVVAEKVSEEKVPESKKLEVEESESEAQQAKMLEQQLIEEQNLYTEQKKQSEKDAEAKAQKGEVSEVVAEKVSQEKVPESKKLEVGESESEAQKAKVLEQQLIEEQKLDTKHKKQTKKDAEKKAQKGEASEVVAEKVSQEKVPESKKLEVGESESEAQKAKILEQHLIDEQKLDTKQKKQSEKDAEKKAQKGEVSEVVGEKVSEDEQEVIKQNLQIKLLDIVKASESQISNEGLQLIVTDSNDIIENLEDYEKVSKCIFKLREHIVHTYDGKSPEKQSEKEMVEAFIESLLNASPAVAEDIINSCLKEIKTNIILTKAAIQLIGDTEVGKKSSLIVPKLGNIENISENIRSKLQIEKSSEKMVHLQQNLMDIFVILDDLLDDKTVLLKPLIEDTKTVLLSEYDYIEQKQGQLQTATVEGKIQTITKHILNVCEKLKHLNKDQIKEKRIEEYQLTENNKLDAENAEKEAKEKAQKGEVPEVVAEKVSEEKVPESKKLEVKESESEAQKAKVLEQQLIEEQKLDTKQKKQAEKDAKEKAQKGEVSEVVAEKVSEEKVSESKKLEVKESESEAQKAKVLEQQLIEDQKLDTKQKKQAEKDAEKKAQKA